MISRYSPRVIEIAADHNIGLISAAELFKAYCEVLETTATEKMSYKTISNRG
jgi:hypothetical protein